MKNKYILMLFIICSLILGACSKDDVKEGATTQKEQTEGKQDDNQNENLEKDQNSDKSDEEALEEKNIQDKVISSYEKLSSVQRFRFSGELVFNDETSKKESQFELFGKYDKSKSLYKIYTKGNSGIFGNQYNMLIDENVDKFYYLKDNMDHYLGDKIAQVNPNIQWIEVNPKAMDLQSYVTGRSNFERSAFYYHIPQENFKQTELSLSDIKLGAKEKIVVELSAEQVQDLTDNLEHLNQNQPFVDLKSVTKATFVLLIDGNGYPLMEAMKMSMESDRNLFTLVTTLKLQDLNGTIDFDEELTEDNHLSVDDLNTLIAD